MSALQQPAYQYFPQRSPTRLSSRQKLKELIPKEIQPVRKHHFEVQANSEKSYNNSDIQHNLEEYSRLQSEQMSPLVRSAESPKAEEKKQVSKEEIRVSETTLKESENCLAPKIPSVVEIGPSTLQDSDSKKPNEPALMHMTTLTFENDLEELKLEQQNVIKVTVSSASGSAGRRDSQELIQIGQSQNMTKKVAKISPEKTLNMKQFKTSTQFTKQMSKEKKIVTPNFRMNFGLPGARRRTFQKKKMQIKAQTLSEQELALVGKFDCEVPTFVKQKKLHTPVSLSRVSSNTFGSTLNPIRAGKSTPEGKKAYPEIVESSADTDEQEEEEEEEEESEESESEEYMRSQTSPESKGPSVFSIQNASRGRATIKEQPVAFKMRFKKSNNAKDSNDGYLKLSRKQTKKPMSTPKFSSSNVNSKVDKPKSKKQTRKKFPAMKFNSQQAPFSRKNESKLSGIFNNTGGKTILASRWTSQDFKFEAKPLELVAEITNQGGDEDPDFNKDQYISSYAVIPADCPDVVQIQDAIQERKVRLRKYRLNDLKRSRSLQFKKSYLDYNTGDACTSVQYSKSSISSSEFHSEESLSQSGTSPPSEAALRNNWPGITYKRWHEMKADQFQIE